MARLSIIWGKRVAILILFINCIFTNAYGVVGHSVTANVFSYAGILSLFALGILSQLARYHAAANDISKKVI